MKKEMLTCYPFTTEEFDLITTKVVCWI